MLLCSAGRTTEGKSLIRAEAPSIPRQENPQVALTKTAVDHILTTPGLSDAERVAILGETAQKLLAIRPASGWGLLRFGAPEHVVLLEQYESKYPYSSGKFPGPADTRSPIPLPPWHMQRPLRAGSASGQESVLVKTVATVDRLSGGRFIFGVGVGWRAEEFQALGISIDRRAQRTREYIEVMRKLEVKDTLGIGANKRRR